MKMPTPSSKIPVVVTLLLIASFLMVAFHPLLASSSARTFEACGFSSTQNHETWYKDFSTNTPVLFPKDDSELRHVVTTARNNGCKVRVRGAGHSQGGMVTTNDNNDHVVVVNLKDYTPDDASWNNHLDTSVPSVRMSAGASILKLMSIIRPRGYLTRTNTAGRFLSVGGAYLNPSVHGAMFEESRLAAQVLRVRVMDAHGVIREHSSKAFRGSMGLLGIVTALEIRIRRDTGISMVRHSHQVRHNTDRNHLSALFRQKLHDYDATEFFYYVHQDLIGTYSVSLHANPDYNVAATKRFYDRELTQSRDLAFTGGVNTLVGGIVGLLAGTLTTHPVLARITARLARYIVNSQFDYASRMPNDGYFAPNRGIPRFEQVQYSIKCASDCVEEMTNLFVETRQKLIQFNRNDGAWYSTFPLEWRIFRVEANEMVLEHLEPGKYLSWGNLALLVKDVDVGYREFFRELEDMWHRMYPNGNIHHGKAYGCDDHVGKRRSAILDRVYSQDVRDEFLELMNTHDPDGTFASSSMLRMLEGTVP